MHIFKVFLLILFNLIIIIFMTQNSSMRDLINNPIIRDMAKSFNRILEMFYPTCNMDQLVVEEPRVDLYFLMKKPDKNI